MTSDFDEIFSLMLSGFWLVMPVISLLVGFLALKAGAQTAGVFLILGGVMGFCSSSFWFVLQLDRFLDWDLIEFPMDGTLPGSIMVARGVGALGGTAQALGLLMLGLAFRAFVRRTELEKTLGS